ncbi:MAG: bifunctional phosphopantothenoylcysteine decarboxylase/phosphopantothenate--cysteine ligase CoaBC [Alicyclobacillus sp.]|nr:bifunctional phosphopantothenoylcysteine decarboxylase/phosphopantothenate--cysteine ligase CoaBC [Alicyclobacillus sp.]
MKKNVLLGVGGGIAAYKAATLCSLLVKAGCAVQVLMTRHAMEFIQPLTFQSLTRQPVLVDTFAEPNAAEIAHIAVADRADVFVVAPATANLIGKLACGIADDMVTTTALAVTAPVVLAPAMNVHMFEHPAVQANLRTLRARGVIVVDPGTGPLACGYTGKGRLAEPEDIAEVVQAVLHPRADLSGLRIVVTAGPTVEELDPVRYVTNASSGKMGYAIAAAAVGRGADVVLVSGPTHLEPVPGAMRVMVRSTEDMERAVLAEMERADVLISAAAPVDFKPAVRLDHKWKKADGTPVVAWAQTPDILAAVGARRRPGQTLVGFAAETDDVVQNAKRKLERKGLDLVVANRIGEPGAGFQSDTNRVTLVFADREVELPLGSKQEVAEQILDYVVQLREGRP